MRMPGANTITLAEGNADLVVDRSDMPAPTIDAVLALFPAWAREGDAPIRDALAVAFGAMANLEWARLGQSIARLASPRFAEGPWLDAWGELLKRPRVASEVDGEYRARLLAAPALITRPAIRGAVDRILTDAGIGTSAVLLEPATDAMFAAPASGDPWCAFAQPSGRRLWASYPDNPNPHVGAYLAPAAPLAEFWVVLPLPTADDTDQAFAMAPEAPSAMTDFASSAASPDRYAGGVRSVPEQVLSDVESRRAGGTRWAMSMDPLLAGAL